MFELQNVPTIERREILARFILFSGWFRASDNAVKQDAFIPHPHTELSLTRHEQASPKELWIEGERVAKFRSRTLYGRADAETASFVNQGLVVEADPIPENPNHANAKNWPADKPAQKMKALQIALKARFVPAPK